MFIEIPINGEKGYSIDLDENEKVVISDNKIEIMKKQKLYVICTHDDHVCDKVHDKINCNGKSDNIKNIDGDCADDHSAKMIITNLITCITELIRKIPSF